MAQPQKLDRFDAFIPREPFVNPWRRDASYAPDLELLSLLLREAVGTEQSSGIVAGATDVWAAEESVELASTPMMSGPGARVREFFHVMCVSSSREA